MRLIDADDLKEELEYYIAEAGWSDAHNEALKWCMELIDNKPTIKTEQQWISDRLPEDGERVLATHLGGLNPDRQVIEHVYVDGKFTLGWDMDMNIDSPTYGQRYMGKVIAWMPLPEPYMGGTE